MQVLPNLHFDFLYISVNTGMLYWGVKCIFKKLTQKKKNSQKKKKEALTGIIPCQEFIFSANKIQFLF